MYHSQASAKQSTGYRHLTEWTLTDKVPEHCSEGSVDFGMIVPLISLPVDVQMGRSDLSIYPS